MLTNATEEKQGALRNCLYLSIFSKYHELYCWSLILVSDNEYSRLDECNTTHFISLLGATFQFVMTIFIL